MTQNSKNNAQSHQKADLSDSEYLNFLRKSLDVAVSILDEDMNYRFISDSIYERLKVDPAKLSVGDPLERCHELMIENGMLNSDFIAENKLSPDEQRRRSQELADNRASQIIELGDGSVHRFIRKVMPNGYTVSMATDISDLVEKDKMLEDALRLGHAGYWILDLSTQKLELSDSLKEEFSAEDYALIEKEGILALVHPQDKRILWEALSEINAENRLIQTTVRITPRNGKERWHQVNAELIQDQTGNWNKVRAFVRDVTRYRTQAEALRLAKDDAIAASLAKSQFLANMSHEIRTPLNGVMGMAELLSRTKLDDRQKDFVDIVTQSATQLLMLINDILDFSRVEAGEMRIDKGPVNMRKALHDVMGLVSPLARKKGLELIINYPENVPVHFLGDLGRIRQIVTNLVGNAIKFTNEGHITLDVGFAEGNEKTGLIIMKVTDTGIGMPKDKLDNIFNKFTQIDNSTTREHGGTGLGLSISKSLVELMNGRIKVDSTPGVGSTFTVYLPLPYNQAAETRQIDTETFEGKRVLIVDDIDINRRILSEMLSGWGMSCVTAPDAFAALEEIKKHQRQNTQFDIIVTDHLMPGMNGQEFAAAISINKSLANTPVIMLSSCDRVISRKELNKLGINEYLVKPATGERLFEAMSLWLSQDTPISTSGPEDTLDIETSDNSASSMNGSLQILIAEDLDLNQKVVEHMLDDSEYAPVFAENGQIALDLYKEDPNRFKVILMDISMPVMDGKAATREIRSFEKRHGLSQTPVIALTGHALKEDRQKFMDAGLDDYLSKPVKRGDLLRMLEKWLARRTDQSSAAA